MALRADEKGSNSPAWSNRAGASLFAAAIPGRAPPILINLAGNAIKFYLGGEGLHPRRLEEADRDPRSSAALRGERHPWIGIPADKVGGLFPGLLGQADGSITRKFGRHRPGVGNLPSDSRR